MVDVIKRDARVHYGRIEDVPKDIMVICLGDALKGCILVKVENGVIILDHPQGNTPYILSEDYGWGDVEFVKVALDVEIILRNE